MAAGDGISLAVHPQAGSKKLPLYIMHRHGVSGQKDIHIALPDQPRQSRGRASVNQRRAADHGDLAPCGLGPHDL